MGVPHLTASSCLINMSEAFSDMFPTNTVVVGPLFSSLSLAITAMVSLLGTAGLLSTGTEETITGVGAMIPMWTGIIGAPETAKENMQQAITPFSLKIYDCRLVKRFSNIFSNVANLNYRVANMPLNNDIVVNLKQNRWTPSRRVLTWGEACVLRRDAWRWQQRPI